RRDRSGPHYHHPVEQLVPPSIIGHPVQFGDGERPAGRRPGLGDRHSHYGASCLTWLPPWHTPPTTREMAKPGGPGRVSLGAGRSLNPIASGPFIVYRRLTMNAEPLERAAAA